MRNIFVLYTQILKILLKLQQLLKKISLIINKKHMMILLLSLFPYVLFFGKLVFPNNVIYSGKDSNTFHYQSKVYLAEKLQNNEYPFWTEKMFLGFPIYADMERGYLNPVNIILVKYLGPFYSYKIIHLVCYLFGSISFYYFLKKYNVTYLGYFVANIIYYFSFFSLYHQQHFNMILTYYLFPVGLFLLDMFVKEYKFRYAILNSLLLSFCFYLGSFQFVFIFILLEVVYLLSLIEKFSVYAFIKRYNGFLIYSFSWFIVLTLPGLLSTYTLYSLSSRSSSLDFIQGSYSPAMVVNLLFPFIFNIDDKFMGSYASKDYFIHETYVYIGISTIIVSFISYLTLKPKDLAVKRFVNILLFIFLLLGFIKYIPILSDINLLPISLFRYWGRSVAFLNLSLSILVGIYISSFTYTSPFYRYFLSFFNFKNENFRTTLYAGFYLILLETFSIINLFPFYINFNNSSIFNLLSILHRYDYIFEYWYFIWFIVLFSTIFILVSNIYIIKSYRNVFLSIIIFFDILIFGFIATKHSLIKNTNTLFPDTRLPTSIINITANKRVLDLTNSINIGNNLVEDYYGIPGYSVLYIDKINEVVKSIGLKSLKHTLLEDEYYLNDVSNRNYFYNSIKELGIEYIIKDLSSSQFLLEELNTYPSYIKSFYRKEGRVLIETSSTEDILLNTYVLKYPGWEVYLNGSKLDIPLNISFDSNYNKNEISDLFINVPLKKGDNVLFLEFYTKDLYLGLSISIIMFLVLSTISYIVFFSKYKLYKI